MPLHAPSDPISEVPGIGSAASPENSGSTLRTAWRLVRFAVSVDPRTLWLTVASSLAGSLAEGSAIILLLPLLAVAGMNFGGSSAASRLAITTQRLLTFANIPHALWLPVVLGIFLAVGGVRSVLRRAQSMLLYTTMTRTELALSRRIYAAVVNAQWAYLVRQRSGRLTHLLTAELRQVAEAIIQTLNVINLGCLILLYLGVALKLSASMTLLVLALGAALMLQQRKSLVRIRSSGEELNEGLGEVYAATEEHLLNIKSVKTYNAEDRDAALFGELCDRVARHTIANVKYQAASAFRFEMGSLTALGAVIFLAVRMLHVQPATTLLLLAIFTRLMPQLASLQNTVHLAAGTLPSYDHILAIEVECLRHAEPEEFGAQTVPPLNLKREVRLNEVWFAYQPGRSVGKDQSDYVLRGAGLCIEAGLMTALVGPSGAGKSTIADLINGLLQPMRGQILLDGTVLDGTNLRQWRRQVGYIGQETVLFHQSIRANLLWARPDATEDDLREAITLSSAEFVYELTGGLESIVGDRGILLSSGQRQRLSLARALLRNPTLLILDEATNALDMDNEARILDGLRKLLTQRRGSLTILMIAHRASSIQRADRIIEIADGQVVRTGTWQQYSVELAR